MMKRFILEQTDDYAPIAAYLGEEGWCLACELSEGKQHCQNEFLCTLERVLPKRLENCQPWI